MKMNHSSNSHTPHGLRPIGVALSLTLCCGLALLPQTSLASNTQTDRSAISAAEQDKATITGTVKDSSGLPILGATVALKGTPGKGTVTDLDGHFTLPDVPLDGTLIISYIGMKSVEVPLSGETTLDVVLHEDSEILDELVVVGYTAQRKESLTGSLQSISASDLKTSTTPSVTNMLSSKVPGVNVAPGSGQPGAKGAVVIRGKSTINGSTAPLWVIDGVIVGNDPGALNPNDIENMTILKDAASTAVYGSQGANGVIVITTRGAKSGKLSVELAMTGAVTSLSKGNLQMMTGQELYDYYDSFANKEQIKFDRWNPELRNSNFDWWDFATQPGMIQSYNLNLSGGSDNISTRASLGYYDEKGAVKGYSFQKYNFSLKSTYRLLNDRLTITPFISGARQDTDDRQHSVGAMYSMLPWDSAVLKDGTPTPHRYSGWVNSNSTNYLYDLQWDKGQSTSYELSGNLNIDIKIFDWLTFSSVNNYRYGNSSSSGYGDPRTSGSEGVNGRITEYRSDYGRRYTNQLLRFNYANEGHYLNGILAYEFNDYKGRYIDVSGTGLVPGFESLNTTTKPERAKGTTSAWAVQSFFTNINYSYNDRYLAQFSLRRDGASNFGTNARYGNFFSISGGWNIHNEAFLRDVEQIHNLKLRLSYGSVGNRPNALYPQYDLYSAAATYNGVSGLLISQIGNPDLTWEKTYTTGIGLDLGLWNRLNLSIDLYDKNTSDLLYPVKIPGVNGVTSIWKNVGAVRNRGIEVTLDASLISTKDWDWSVNFNIGHNRNKVEALYGRPDEKTGEVPPMIIGGGTGVAGEAERILKVGHNADTWYLPEWAGVDPKTGAPQWYTNTLQADGSRSREVTTKYAQAEKVMIGTFTPTVFGGLSTNLRWKDLDLGAVFGYSVGGQLYNYTRMEYDSDGAYTDRNQMKLMKGWTRWEKEGDIATHPKALYENKSLSNKTSSRYLEDGSFLKLRSLTLGYNWQINQYNIQSARIFLMGENLFTLTKYSGVDPELPSQGGSIIGTTTTVYPSTRKISLGVNLYF